MIIPGDMTRYISEEMPQGIEYLREEIPSIIEEKEYQEYTENIKEKSLLEYFTRNSWVFQKRITVPGENHA